MAESWGDFFTRVGKATLAGLEIVAAATSRVEVAFCANRQRACGIIWLPKTRQALHYTVNWANRLELRGKSAVEIELINVLLGLTMWGGLINAHRVARDPVVKVGYNFALEMSNRGENERGCWSTVQNCIDGIAKNTADPSAYYDDDINPNPAWDYIVGAQKQSEDVKFQQVKRLCEGRMLPSNSGLDTYVFVQWNPMPFFDLVLGII